MHRAEGFLRLCGREGPLKKVLTFMATAITNNFFAHPYVEAYTNTEVWQCL
jgi:hypothetical protein